MTPVRPGGGKDGVAPSPWESETPRRGGGRGNASGGGNRGSSRGSWDGKGGGATPALPQVARPGGGARVGTAGSGVGGGRVKFETGMSPALTPSWKSTSWSKAAAKREAVEAGSPKLREDDQPDEHKEFDDALR